ncbi:hypothetical protein ACQ4PT_011740 [Festuca glaucescens]
MGSVAAAAGDREEEEGAGALLALLQRVQSEALRALGPRDFDPKLYVDLPLAPGADRAAAEAALASVTTRDEMEAYLARYFAAAGSDLLAADPPDFEPEPRGFLPRVAGGGEALEVHALWKYLARRVAPGVAARPGRHTLLPLPGMVVVPGSRGLLVSKMYDTAKDIVLNLVYLVEEYGFVLNGARSYYTNRSQPPLLSSMVLEIYMATGDLGLVRRAFPSLLKEHSFWISELHNVAIMDNDGCVHNLSRYQAMWNKPRPESATIDEELASKLNSAGAKEKLYHQIAAAAETGWDFSSRWMRLDVQQLMLIHFLFDKQVAPQLPTKGMPILHLINMYHMFLTISFLCEVIQLT